MHLLTPASSGRMESSGNNGPPSRTNKNGTSDTKGVANQALEIESDLTNNNGAAVTSATSTTASLMKQSIVKRTEALLNGIQTNLQRDDLQSAAVSLCHAYSFAPRRTRKQLRRQERDSLQKLVKVLEKFCLEDVEVPIPVPKVIDLILSPELDTNNGVAWRTRLREQIGSEHYEEIVLNSDRLRNIPKGPETAEILLLSSLAHIKLAEKEVGIELYMEAFHVDGERATHCLRAFTPLTKEVFRGVFLEKASRLYNNMMSLSAKDNVDMLNYYNEILRIKPDDVTSAEIYGQLLMKVLRYNDAKHVFSRCIDILETQGDLLEAVRFRLFHAECLVNTAAFDEAIIDYLEAMEHDSYLTNVTLQALSNAHVTKLTSCIIEQASALVHDISATDNPDRDMSTSETEETSEAETSKNALQLYRRLYKLLYAIDSENVQALRKCAECLQVAGKHEDAVALLTEAIRKTPSVHLLCERALSYLGMKHFNNARSDLECASHLQANSIELRCCRAYLNFLTENTEDAVQDLNHAFTSSSSATVKVIQRFTEEQLSTIVLGIERFLRDWMKKTKRSLKLKSKFLISLCDLLVSISPKKLQNYLQYSALLIALDKSDEAQAIMLRMVKTSPTDCVPIIHLAALRLELGNSNLAIEGFCSVLREVDEECLAAELAEFPKKKRAQISREAHTRGLTLYREEKFLQAIDCFGVAIAAAGCSAPDSYLARARCLLHLQHYMKAISDFTAVLRRAPACVEARCGRACVYIRLQEHADASRDILASLHSNIPATTRFFASLPGSKQRMVLFTIEKYLQHAFTFCGQENGGIATPMQQDSSISCGETILLLANFLVNLNSKNPKYLSVLGDAHIVHQNYPEAIASLNVAQGLTPLDVSITARVALLHTKLGNTSAAMAELYKLAEDWDTLTFCVQAIDPDSKAALAQNSFQHGDVLRKQENNVEALKYFSLAVATSACQDAGILRARGKCLETLQEYSRAVRDFSSVLTLPKPHVSDYCARAMAYMMDDEESKACKDFISALKIDQKAALSLIASRPGNDTALQIFVQSARIAHARKDYTHAHTVCEYGLLLDETDCELLKLKEKCENSMQKCVIQ